jgi:hypothetical protein
MRLPLLFVMVLLAGCAPAPAPAPQPKAAVDPVTEPWYGVAATELAAVNHEAEGFLREGKDDQAAAAITKGQALATRLLAAPRPTLTAMEAASDLDQLYARMLLGNRNYGWARLTYQKNASRWKNWRPQTGETARRLKLAQDGIDECDRRIAQ